MWILLLLFFRQMAFRVKYSIDTFQQVRPEFISLPAAGFWPCRELKPIFNHFWLTKRKTGVRGPNCFWVQGDPRPRLEVGQARRWWGSFGHSQEFRISRGGRGGLGQRDGSQLPMLRGLWPQSPRFRYAQENIFRVQVDTIRTRCELQEKRPKKLS